MPLENVSIPVIFTAFANQANNYLPQLIRERDELQKTLSPLDSQNIIKHLNRDDTTVESLFDALKDYAGKVRIFHYAGHAGKEVLELEGQKAFMKGIIARLIAENKAGGIDLVFLNGCSTYENVQALLAGGIKGVIATTASIDDGLATDLAIAFYKNLASQQDIPTAFENAKAYLQAKSNEEKVLSMRFVEFAGSENDTFSTHNFHWGFFVSKKGVLDNKTLATFAGKETIENPPQNDKRMSYEEFITELQNLVKQSDFTTVFDKLDPYFASDPAYMYSNLKQNIMHGFANGQMPNLGQVQGLLMYIKGDEIKKRLA